MRLCSQFRVKQLIKQGITARLSNLMNENQSHCDCFHLTHTVVYPQNHHFALSAQINWVFFSVWGHAVILKGHGKKKVYLVSFLLTSAYQLKQSFGSLLGFVYTQLS